MAAQPAARTALVVGGTGAIGEELVRQLVVNPAFAKVITVGRRPVPDVPAGTATLEQKQVNMDNLQSEAKAEFQQADVVFCALGTTRKVAGSAEAFKKVDFDYVAASASLAKECGVKHFSLVSAQGANHKCPANDFALFHALLYTRTKGLAEQAVLTAGFPRASVFRPGLLNRGDKARTWESVVLPIAPAIHVKDVARIMILDALREPSTVSPTMIFENGAMKAAAKEGVAPRC